MAAEHYPVDDWLSAPPADPDELTRYALQMHETGQGADAERLLMSIQERYPDQPAAYAALGDVYMHLGEYDMAIGQYAALRKLVPQEVGPVLRLTDSQIKAGYFGDALAELRAVMTKHPQDPDLQLHAMRVLDKVGGGQAWSFVEDWVAQDRDNGEARQMLAAQYGSSGSYQEALAQLDYLVKNHPELANVHIYRAAVLEELGLMEEALTARETATAMAPQNPAYRLALAQQLIRGGQPAKAAEQIQAAIDLMPENSGREPAIEQLAVGQVAKAAEYIQAALNAVPDGSRSAPAVEQSSLVQAFVKKGQPGAGTARRR